MRRSRSQLRWGPLIALLVVAAGCGDSPESKTSKAAPAPANAPSYQATLEEGIDFRRDGVPTFISEVTGLSGREPFGRWSDANLGPSVRVVFREPLPRKFEVALTALVMDQNEKLPVLVRAGGVEQSVSFEKPGTLQTQTIVFDLPQDTNTMEIVAPKPVAPHALDPKNQDQRQLGIALTSLRIRKL